MTNICKAFISHRSTHKALAETIVAAVGRDYCWLDKYDIEPAARTLEAVIDGLRTSPIFVLLLSSDAYDTVWVKTEIRKAKHLLEEGQIRYFLTFLVDDGMTYTDAPQWMRDDDVCFNLRIVKSPVVIANIIKGRQRELLQENHLVHKPNFIGRTEQLAQFQSLFYSTTGRDKRGLVVSGRAGIGRGAFLRACLNQINVVRNIDDCFTVALGAGQGVEDIIVQLHHDLGYQQTDLLDVLGMTYDDKLRSAANYIKEITDYGSYLLIDDNQCCIEADGKPALWFEQLLSSAEMPAVLRVLVKSRVKLQTRYRRPQIIHIALPPMDDSECGWLYQSLCTTYNLPEEYRKHADYFVSTMPHSPKLICQLMSEMRYETVVEAKELWPSLQSKSDDDLQDTLGNFDDDPASQNLLAIACETTMLTCDLVRSLYPFDYEVVYLPALRKLEAFSIFSAFGVAGECYTIDYDVADYLRRNHLASLNDNLQRKLAKAVRRNISDASKNEFDDLPLFIYRLRKELENGNEIATTFLLPSVVLTTVTRLYERAQYAEVIRLCERVKNTVRNYSEQARQDLLFKKCQAHCRLRQADEFFVAVEQISDYANREFLKGFFFRITRKHTEALTHLSNALSKCRNMQTAKREIVNVYLDQNQFTQARTYAYDNYRAMRYNPFHIYAWFRCLLRTAHVPLSADIHQQLRDLIAKMKAGRSPKKGEMLQAMELEYMLFGQQRTEKEKENALLHYANSVMTPQAVRDVIRSYKHTAGQQ